MTIKNGSSVSINYTLKVDGNVVDSSEGREPLTYVQGSSQIIPGLEKEMEGLKIGDKKSVTVSPESGYGVRDERLIHRVPAASFKDGGTLKVGDVVNGKVQGETFQAQVTAVSPNEITLDLNHPLAGKTLNFDVEVVAVK